MDGPSIPTPRRPAWPMGRRPIRRTLAHSRTPGHTHGMRFPGSDTAGRSGNRLHRAGNTSDGQIRDRGRSSSAKYSHAFDPRTGPRQKEILPFVGRILNQSGTSMSENYHVVSPMLRDSGIKRRPVSNTRLKLLLTYVCNEDTILGILSPRM